MGAKPLLSLTEFENLYNRDTGDMELLHGELVCLPVAERRQREIGQRLFELLDAALELRGVQETMGEFHFLMGYLLLTDPPCWLRPDVSLPHHSQPGERYYEGAPLMVFEVVSQYDTAPQLDLKVATYLANGTAEVWTIYPEARHAWVYRKSAPTAIRETEAIHSELLPGISIPLDEIL